AFALRYVVDRTAAAGLVRYGSMLAASAAGAFLVSVPPGHWGHAVCDEIAINWAAPAILTGALLALGAGKLELRSMWARGALVAAVAAASAAIFVALEPRCLGGPYAMMDPRLRGLWFDHVSEMEPLWEIARPSPAPAGAGLIFPAAALLAPAPARLRARASRRSGVLHCGERACGRLRPDRCGCEDVHVRDVAGHAARGRSLRAPVHLAQAYEPGMARGGRAAAYPVAGVGRCDRDWRSRRRAGDRRAGCARAGRLLQYRQLCAARTTAARHRPDRHRFWLVGAGPHPACRDRGALPSARRRHHRDAPHFHAAAG